MGEDIADCMQLMMMMMIHIIIPPLMMMDFGFVWIWLDFEWMRKEGEKPFVTGVTNPPNDKK